MLLGSVSMAMSFIRPSQVGQHPLPRDDLEQDVLNEIGRGGAPAAAEARRAEAVTVTAERRDRLSSQASQ
jgi:hypothetical protein